MNCQKNISVCCIDFSLLFEEDGTPVRKVEYYDNYPRWTASHGKFLQKLQYSSASRMLPIRTNLNPDLQTHCYWYLHIFSCEYSEAFNELWLMNIRTGRERKWKRKKNWEKTWSSIIQSCKFLCSISESLSELNYTLIVCKYNEILLL